MFRRTILAALPASLLLARAAAAEVPLAELSRYFNGITTLEARFVQVNDDGSQSTGTLYMRRPGRARFEYDPPEASLVMAGGGTVAVFDGRSNRRDPEQYPLKRTPLSIVLDRKVELRRSGMILGHSGSGGRTTLTVQDPEAPENGRVELVFIDDPLTLAGWTVIDGGGARTRVQLQEIRLGGSLSNLLFSIPHEIQARQ